MVSVWAKAIATLLRVLSIKTFLIWYNNNSLAVSTFTMRDGVTAAVPVTGENFVDL